MIRFISWTPRIRSTTQSLIWMDQTWPGSSNSERHRSTTHQPQWRYRLRWTMPNHSLLTRSMHNPRIELIFLPPYAPDLNLIERYWRFFKKEILYDKYYQTFPLFKQACDDCFAASNGYREALRSLLTDNFQIIDCA
ncbi:DDE superfamily endonuclease [Nitrosomonas communis]|uniref:DDE superfamily endonuclease n=1 Tax=Nitrosomonas communis TaxID=44574 RepID=A0A5D3YBN8_9PROT|nr:DDE superfamily endonuclease [Nitrosomonas communis]